MVTIMALVTVCEPGRKRKVAFVVKYVELFWMYSERVRHNRSGGSHTYAHDAQELVLPSTHLPNCTE